MLAFQFRNQIAHLRQFAFAFLGLMVWSANEAASMSVVWAVLLLGYPSVVHWAGRRAKALTGNSSRIFVLDAVIVFVTVTFQSLPLLSLIATIGSMAFTARLCLLPTSQAYRLIRFILIVALAHNGSSTIEGLKQIGLEQSLGLAMLLGLCFFSARTAGLISSERARLLNAAKQTQQQTTQQLTSLKPYLSKPLMASAIQTQAARRLPLIIFFADLIDSTGTMERLAEQAFTDFLSDYLMRMGQLVLRFDGTLDKYTGDGLMVVFGLDGVQSQQALARQCALMALAMRQEFRQLEADCLGKDQYFDTGQRMGIHAGVCLAGSVGCAEQLNFTVLGRAVHIAARLEQHAELNQILVSAEFGQLLGSEFVLESRPPAALSGLKRPLANSALLD